MSAALVVPAATHVRKRSFFFALSSDQREFVFRGANKERLMLSTLSLGFGARDEVHVLEAEGASADGENNVQMQVQTTTMLGVQPSLPAVTLNSPVLALPVTFKLRSGPGPLYISGNHLVGPEEAGAVASIMTAAKSPPTACEEPAQKQDSAAWRKGNTRLQAIQEKEKFLEILKTKLMERVLTGEKLSLVRKRFRKYLKRNHNVTNPILVAELWKWRLTCK